jgi:pyruvate,water dikinase
MTLAEPADTTEPAGGTDNVHSCDAVVWLDEVDPERAIRAGGSKMGRLAELLRSGVQVPQGFAVTVDAYARHCRESGLDDRIDAVIARLGGSPDDAAVLEPFAAPAACVVHLRS